MRTMTFWLALLGLGACSPGGSVDGYSSTITSFCDNYCSTVSGCDGAADLQTCNAECLNRSAATVPKIRTDILSSIQSCVKGKKCSEVLLGTVQQACANEVVAGASAPPSATEYCSALDKALLHCGMTAGDKSECLNSAKLYNDSTLNRATGCLGAARSLRRAA